MPKSRGNREGSYRKTKSGKIEGSVMVGLKDNGHPLIKYVTMETLADAKSAIREILDTYQPAQIDSKTKMLEFADAWYKEYEGKVEKSTYDSYQYTVAHIKATWGKKAIGKITTEDIEKGLETLAGSVSFSYLGKVKTMLGQIFRRAEVKGAIRHGYNPMNGLDRLRDNKGSKPKKDSFTLNEITTLRKSLPDNRIGHAIRVMLACGMRGQEIIALKASDIEPDGSVIEVTKAVKMSEGKPYLGKPKSDAGDRRIYVPKHAVRSAKWLRDHPAGMDYPGMKFTEDTSAESLFLNTRYCLLYPTTTLKGAPSKRCGLMPTDVFRDNYKKVVKGVDVRELTPHCIRHTYNTMHVVKLHTDPKVLQSQAGQSDMETTLGYAHVHDEDMAAAAEAYDHLITGAESTKKRRRYRLVKPE
jgi:integrase